MRKQRPWNTIVLQFALDICGIRLRIRIETNGHFMATDHAMHWWKFNQYPPLNANWQMLGTRQRKFNVHFIPNKLVNIESHLDIRIPNEREIALFGPKIHAKHEPLVAGTASPTWTACGRRTTTQTSIRTLYMSNELRRFRWTWEYCFYFSLAAMHDSQRLWPIKNYKKPTNFADVCI